MTSDECKICGKEIPSDSYIVDVGYDVPLCQKHYDIATYIFMEVIDALEEAHTFAKESLV